MKARLDFVTKQCKIAKHTVLETIKGSDLSGLEYEPLFPYYKEEKKDTKCFTVITATYITTDAGTGIVH